MNAFLKDIAEFHTLFGFVQKKKPGFLSDEKMGVRLNFQLEELMETADAAGFELMVNTDEETGAITVNFERNDMLDQDLHRFFDGIIDQAYVLFGTAWHCNLPFQPGWERVHGANMLKRRAESADESKRGTTFDVVKPEGWTPPTFYDLLTPMVPAE